MAPVDGYAQERFGCVLHAYVCMVNHYHLILETPEKNLSRVMHYLNSSYSTYINVKRNRSGHLLQGRFKSIVVDKDASIHSARGVRWGLRGQV